MDLWEYNAYTEAIETRQKSDIANAILTGYYTAYYMNSGKKAKSPNELIKGLFNSNKAKKQSFSDGLADIEKLREFERRMSGE